MSYYVTKKCIMPHCGKSMYRLIQRKKVFYTHETILFKCFEIKQVENLTMEVQPRKFCLGVKAILQSGFTVYAVD